MCNLKNTNILNRIVIIIILKFLFSFRNGAILDIQTNKKGNKKFGPKDGRTKRLYIVHCEEDIGNIYFKKNIFLY